MELWNVRNLGPPPVNTCKGTTKEIDIRLVTIALKEGVEFFKSQQHLCTEAALISRTAYRLKMKFRSSKDFKALEKLSRVLRTYLQMKISNMLNTILKTIPHEYKVNKSMIFTKNMMDFALVRLQGLGKLLCRILETCKEISYLARQRLRLGHFWKLAAIVYAITARVFVITKSILKYSCKLYEELLPVLPNLNNTGMKWLPGNYVFPEHLEEWLGVDWLDLDKSVIEIPDEDQTRFTYYNLIDDSDDDVEISDEYVIINDSISVSNQEEFNQSVEMPDVTQKLEQCNVKNEHQNEDENNLSEDDDDFGEVIDISDTDVPKEPMQGTAIRRKPQRINRSSIHTPQTSNEAQKKRAKNDNNRLVNNTNLIYLTGMDRPKFKRQRKRARAEANRLKRLKN